jgi:hypothetical protein
LIALPGVAAPSELKEVYTKAEAYTMAFDYYLEQVDAAWANIAFSDLDTIQAGIEKAAPFAFTRDQKLSIEKRSTRLNLITLLYKADLAASKGTKSDIEEALDYLEAASRLELEESQTRLVQEKTEALRSLIDASGAGLLPKTETPKADAPEHT